MRMKGIKHVGALGKYVSHKKECLPIIEKMVREFNPSLMIEFGTGKAGFTYILHQANKNAEIHSYDIKPDNPIKTESFNKNVTFHRRCDILTEEIDEIIELLISKKKKLLYCDNGKKEQEVKMYAKYLNSGDMLGVHDWGIEVFYENIYDELKYFYQHPINNELNYMGCLSRFWIRGN